MSDAILTIKNTVIGFFTLLSLLGQGELPKETIIRVETSPPVVIEKPAPILGSTISAVADFRASLTAGISSSATEMLLNTTSSGSDSLVAGEYYGFKLGGREYVTGYLSTSTANKIVYMTRGLSRRTATTSVTAYKEEWGRGTSVEMTDAPILIDLTNKASGKADYEVPIKYSTSIATTTIAADEKNLVNVELLNDTAFNGAGVIACSETVSGVCELATQVETASSTSSGSSGRLAIPAVNATSTYNSATAGLRVVVTQNNGKIDNNFIDTSAQAFTGTIASTTTFTTGIKVLDIGKNFQVFTATSSVQTFTTPSGVTKVFVRLVGGGGGGGGGSGIDTTQGAGGGGGGGYAENICDLTGVSTTNVSVGAEGSRGSATQSTPNGGSGGPSYFGTCVSASGGASGTSRVDINLGGLPGVASSTPGKALFGSAGQIGGTGISYTGGLAQLGGFGGGSMFGTGALPSAAGDANGVDCATSTNGYGGGGSGAEVASTNRTGGLGCPGLVIVSW